MNDSTTAIATCERAKQFDGRTQPHTCSRNVGHYPVEGGHERFANEEGVITQLTEELSSGNVQNIAKNKANELYELLRAFLLPFALLSPAINPVTSRKSLKSRTAQKNSMCCSVPQWETALSFAPNTTGRLQHPPATPTRPMHHAGLSVHNVPQGLHLEIFKDLELCDLLLLKVNEPLVLQRLRLDNLEMPQHLHVKELEPHIAKPRRMTTLSTNR